MEAQETFI